MEKIIRKVGTSLGFTFNSEEREINKIKEGSILSFTIDEVKTKE